MNYQKVYACIVLRAQAEHDIRQQLKIDGEYFEIHHIIPKSLGGSNLVNNLAILTAREHFICHWLLVKMYVKGTKEYDKMLNAFWRMQSTNEYHNRYIFSRAYDHLRKEFANRIGKLTSVSQRGTRNSQYGMKWYTNYETGLSKKFQEAPGGKWVKGRGVYNGQSSSLMYLLCGTNNGIPPKNLYKPRSNRDKFTINKESETHAKAMWDEFHSSNYTSLNDYAIYLKISKVAVYNWFCKYIPKFKLIDKSKGMVSNRNLIGVYF